jgi:hypothetical protein
MLALMRPGVSSRVSAATLPVAPPRRTTEMMKGRKAVPEDKTEGTAAAVSLMSPLQLTPYTEHVRRARHSRAHSDSPELAPPHVGKRAADLLSAHPTAEPTRGLANAMTVNSALTVALARRPIPSAPGGVSLPRAGAPVLLPGGRGRWTKLANTPETP